MQLWNLQSNEKTRAKQKLKGLLPWAPTLKSLLLLHVSIKILGFTYNPLAVA